MNKCCGQCFWFLDEDINGVGTCGLKSEGNLDELTHVDEVSCEGFDDK